MSLIQSGWAKGSKQIARPQTAFAAHTQLFMFPVPAKGFAAGDVLELAAIPPYSVLSDASLVAVGAFTDATVDVGIMSGEFGDDDATRTIGSELFSKATPANITRLVSPAALLRPKADKEQAIGIKFNTAVTFAAGMQIGVQLTFAQ